MGVGESTGYKAIQFYGIKIHNNFPSSMSFSDKVSTVVDTLPQAKQ